MPHKKNGVPRFFRETPFDLALFNYINLSAVVFSCKIFVKFCSLSKLQVILMNYLNMPLRKGCSVYRIFA